MTLCQGILGRGSLHQEGIVSEGSFQGLSVKSQDSINMKCIDPVWGLRAGPHQIGGHLCMEMEIPVVLTCII